MKTYTLTDNQDEKITKWFNNHKCEMYPRNTLTIMFTLTGIGTAVEGRCSCGKSLNVTEFGTW